MSYAARMPEAWIIDGVRSPRGRGKESGSLHDIHPQELLAQVLNALVERVGVDPAQVEDVIIGNNSNVGDHGNVIGLSLPLFRELLNEVDVEITDLWR